MTRIRFSPSASIPLLAICLIPLTAPAALTVTKVSQVTRPSSATYGAEQISGITYAGGDLYYAVDDNDVKLYPLTLAISRSDGSLSTAGISIGTGVTMSGSHDMEGCAFDPCSGKVWISQETNALIREFDPETGELLRSAPVPAVQKQYAGNYSLEALTIAGDGLAMWTANEEALTVDGALATNSVGSVVRLTKFTRRSVRDNWTPSGEWAYETQPIGSVKDSHTRSGVSGLCALPDGTLLVLERRCYNPEGFFPDFNIRLYQVNFSGATDISSFAALKNASYTKTTKTLLWQYTHGTDMPNYEGICLGPNLDDGSCTLVLISDGGSYAEEGVITLKLTGLDVRTMYFIGPEGCEPSGGPYRFLVGDSVAASLPGAGSPYEARLREHPSWSAEGHQASGEGSLAMLTIATDDIFRWGTAMDPALPLLATDSFERLPANTEAPDLAGWSGEGYVAEATYAAPDPAGFPLNEETHTAVLVVDGDVERDYADLPGEGAMLDTMVRVTRESAESPVEDAEGQIALFFDVEGRPTLQHLAADGAARLRTALSPKTYADGSWVRAGFFFDYSTGTPWCQMLLDGEPCVTDAGVRSPAEPTSPGAWYRTLAPAATKVSSLLLRGTGAVDDVALYDAAGALEFAQAGATTNGVPYVWLTEQGLPWNPDADADGDAYTAHDEYAAGTDPWDETDYLRILGADFEDGRFTLRFTGTAPLANFHVVSGDDLALPGAQWIEADGGIVRSGPGINVWTQAEAPAEGEDTRFFRVRAILPE